VSYSCIEKIIHSCPFEDVSYEVCKHLEGMLNGICEAINPSYEFAYDRMMTMGDKSCHWTIKKKESMIEKPESQVADKDEMLRKLKWRLTNGEITPEQYKELRDLLLE
jgi:hypothetical protein